MPDIITCLWFDTQGEQAATFYAELFPNSGIRKITRYAAGGIRSEGEVMTVEFSLDGHDFLALNGGPEFTFTEAVSFQIMCATQEDVDRYWTTLSEGGQEGPCGWLKDRFGLSWQVVPTRLPELMGDPDPGRARRTTAAMMAMGKLDIAALERAADGG